MDVLRTGQSLLASPCRKDTVKQVVHLVKVSYSVPHHNRQPLRKHKLLYCRMKVVGEQMMTRPQQVSLGHCALQGFICVSLVKRMHLKRVLRD